MNIEQAYLSAVFLAQGLGSANHAKAEAAVKLKEAIAKAVTHPESMTEESFTHAWATRGQFAGLHLPGEQGVIVEKHAALLAGMDF